MTDERLKEAVEQITLTEEAGKRILNLQGKKTRRDQRRRTAKRSLLAVCLIVSAVLGCSYFPKGFGQTPEWKITAYAKG